MPTEALRFQKILLDIENPSAPLAVYLIAAGLSKEQSVIYSNLWVPHGPSTVEVDLGWIRASASGKGALNAIQVGPEKPIERDISVFVDNIRLSMTGAMTPAPPEPGSREPVEPNLFLPNGGFEEGLNGWIPKTWASCRAAFGVVRGADAFQDAASAGIFHHIDGQAGLRSPELHLTPGRYSLCLAVRSRDGSELIVEREEPTQTPSGDLTVSTTSLGTLSAGKEWEEKWLEIDLPPRETSQEQNGELRNLRLVFRSGRGDLFLDGLELSPQSPEKGGPETDPPPAEPIAPENLAFLAIGPALLSPGGWQGITSCGDLSPALLGGGPPEGAVQMAKRSGDKTGIRLWCISASGRTSGFSNEGSILGITPAEVREAKKFLASVDRRPIAILVRTDEGGMLDTFSDAADLLAGGVPLRISRRSGGLSRYAEGLKVLRRAATSPRGNLGQSAPSLPGREKPSRPRPAVAWIDLRVPAGEAPATAGELRAMAYLALAHSCDALLFAPFEMERNAPELQLELDRLENEFKKYARELGEPLGGRVVEPSDRRIYGHLRYLKEGHLLILVNSAPESVENFNLRLPAGVPGSGETRSLEPYEGRLEKLAGEK